MKKEFEIFYSDIVDMSNHKFSQYYEKFISETVEKNGSSVVFKEKSFIIKSPNMVKLLMATMFIGYALALESEGR